MSASGWCEAISQAGALVTVYARGRVGAARAKGREFICTLDPGHKRSHSACDGAGHVLARWPRAEVEVFWEPADCKGHSHGS